jgi:SAM-dependent methyltransferase
MKRLINLGCGTNKLPAPWENYDRDIDITRKLPFQDGSVTAIVIEHCLEHVSPPDAWRFMEEACRVLEPGGVLRITVPNIAMVEAEATPAYLKFAKDKGWSDGSYEGAVKALVCGHGHLTIWHYTLMRICLQCTGFSAVIQEAPGVSTRPYLRGVEGHWRVIGRAINDIESMTVEAVK